MKRTLKLELLSIGCMALAAMTLIATVPAADKPKANRQAKTQKVQAGKTTLTVGKPLTQGNLTVFPVYGQAQRKVGSQYLSLGEALKKQLIVVKEMPDAEVNRVSVTSKAGKPLYLMAGDIILGGQQDREIARDTIVPKAAKNYVVEVFCVEHGRWTGSQHFSGGEIASSSLRRETQQTKQQERVWNKVAQEVQTLKAQTSSGTYRAVASNQAAQNNVSAYVKALGARLKTDRRALGLVVAINGQVTAADVFADPHLFQQQLSKLLKSYALDAVQDKANWARLRKKPVPSAPAALQLLRDADRGVERTTARSMSTVNRERENASTVVFDAAPQGPSTTGSAAAPAHRNIYRKK